MNVLRQFRAPARIRKSVYNNPDRASRADTPKIITVKVQVKVGAWLTVWAATCDLSDGDTRAYLMAQAEQVANQFDRNNK